MLYLLDANVLITAHQLYYPIDRVPEFWEWLRHNASQGKVKMPLEMFEEIKDTNKAEKDLLFAWVKDSANKAALLLDEEPNETLVRKVVYDGYAPDLTDDQIEQLGRDPFLIAYGLANPRDRWIVTTEVSKPSSKRQNRKVPDVCKSMAVECCDTFRFCRDLGFSTSWKR